VVCVVSSNPEHVVPGGSGKTEAEEACTAPQAECRTEEDFSFLFSGLWLRSRAETEKTGAGPRTHSE